MIEKGQDTIKGNRIYFLDNLRTFMIFLVVLNHHNKKFSLSKPPCFNLSSVENLMSCALYQFQFT